MKFSIWIAILLIFWAGNVCANPQVIDLTSPTSSNSMTSDAGLVKTNQNNSLDDHLHQTAYQYGVNPLLIKAIIKAESNYQVDARSPKGALGLMQVLPTTAAQYGNYNLFNPKDNITVGTRHFAYLMNKYQGQVHLALAAYNAGEGNVAKYDGIPPFTETRQYIIKVSKYYQSLHPDDVAPIVTQEQNHQQAVSTQDGTTHESNHSPPKKPPTVLIIDLH